MKSWHTDPCVWLVGSKKESTRVNFNNPELPTGGCITANEAAQGRDGADEFVHGKAELSRLLLMNDKLEARVNVYLIGLLVMQATNERC